MHDTMHDLHTMVETHTPAVRCRAPHTRRHTHRCAHLALKYCQQYNSTAVQPTWMYSPGSTRENTVLVSTPLSTMARKFATVPGARRPYRPGGAAAVQHTRYYTSTSACWSQCNDGTHRHCGIRSSMHTHQLHTQVPQQCCSHCTLSGMSAHMPAASPDVCTEPQRLTNPAFQKQQPVQRTKAPPERSTNQEHTYHNGARRLSCVQWDDALVSHGALPGRLERARRNRNLQRHLRVFQVHVPRA